MKELEELIRRAETEDLWLCCVVDPDTVFTPKQLRRENAEGRFRWGPSNWVLVIPENEIRRRERAIENMKSKYEAFRRRMREEG